MKRARFEVWEHGVDSTGWNWRLRGANGRVVCTASGFNNKIGAKRAARRSQYILGGTRQLQIIEVVE